MTRTRRIPWLIGVVAAVAVAFFAVPLVGIIERANWSTVARDITSPEALQALRVSLITSLSATALSLVFGTPLAWVLARSDVPGRSLIRGLVLLPLVLPPVVGGVALLSAFSLRSPIGGWLHSVFGLQFTFTIWGAIMAATFVALPFYVIAVEGALRAADQRFEDAARGLGAGHFMVFRRVTLPMIAPSIVAGATLAWARALGEFGATITFAGNIAERTRTLPLAVYLELDGNPDAAIAMSLALIVVSLLLLVALRDRWVSTL